MSRRRVLIAIVVAVVATAFVSWALIGDLSCECPGRERPLDTMFDGPTLSATTTFAVGFLSALALAGSVVVVTVAIRRRAVRFGDVRFAVPLLLGAVYVALTYRAVTAGVIGANIGGGMMLLGSPVVALPLAVWAVVWRPPSRRRARPVDAAAVDRPTGG